MKTNHVIYYGDGSEAKNFEQMKRVINLYQNDVQIRHFHWPSLNDRQTTWELVLKIEEDFACWMGDDDFMIPESVSQCAEFLEKNKDYRTAHGDAMMFELKKTGPYGAFKGSTNYGAPPKIEHDKALDRLGYFSSNYWPLLFSMHRTDELIEDMKATKLMTERGFGEKVSCFMSAANGKSKHLDCLYLIRQVHNCRYIIPSSTALMRSKSFKEAHSLFLKTISQTISIKDGIEVKEAHRRFKEAHDEGYMQPYKKKLERDESSRVDGLLMLKTMIRNIPFVGSTLMHMRALIKGKRGELNHIILLKRDHPYYESFLPVYNAIVKQTK